MANIDSSHRPSVNELGVCAPLDALVAGMNDTLAQNGLRSGALVEHTVPATALKVFEDTSYFFDLKLPIVGEIGITAHIDTVLHVPQSKRLSTPMIEFHGIADLGCKGEVPFHAAATTKDGRLVARSPKLDMPLGGIISKGADFFVTTLDKRAKASVNRKLEGGTLDQSHLTSAPGEEIVYLLRKK